MTTPNEILERGYLLSAAYADTASRLGEPVPESHLADELDRLGSSVLLVSRDFARGHLVSLLKCHDLEAKWILDHYDGSGSFSLFVYDVTRIINKFRVRLLRMCGPPDKRGDTVVWHYRGRDVTWRLDQQLDAMVEMERRDGDRKARAL